MGTQPFVDAIHTAAPMDTQPFVDAIHSNFPDLPVASIELAGEGLDSIALLVSREWIFRFPKHDGVSA